MKIYMTSDIHADYYVHKGVSVEHLIDTYLEEADVLLAAGDTSDNPFIFLDFYTQAAKRYEKIFLVLGNHDLTVHNDSYFKENPFTETQAKIDWLKHEISKLKNVTLLDGTVEEYGGLKIGGTMGMNDFTYAQRLYPLMSRNEMIEKWHSWFDYVNWNYKHNDHEAIREDEMNKLATVISQQPDIVMTHFIPLFFGVDAEYARYFSSTYFYFNPGDCLKNVGNKMLWLAGHTHNPQKKIDSSNGAVINCCINPVGYPDEKVQKYNGWKRSDFMREF